MYNITVTKIARFDFYSTEASKKKKRTKHNGITGGEISIISDRVVKWRGAGFLDVYLIFMEVARSS